MAPPAFLALLRGHHETLGRLHRCYGNKVAAELEDRGVIPADESNSPYGASTRALAIWFTA